jgi:acyl-CoA dehydrogenase
MTMTKSEVTTMIGHSGQAWIEHAQDVAIRIAPFAASHDQDGSFVTEAFDLLKAEGFAGALVPTEFGGGGITHSEAGAVLRELAKGCPATAVALSMHFHIVATQVWRHNHGQPAAGVLRKVAAGNLILISTGAADWVNSYGEAVAVEGGFRVTVRKSPSSGAPAGDLLVASVPWADAPEGPQILHFTVPFSAEGVSIDETWDTMGLRGTGSHTVVLEDVFVPAEAVSLMRPADQWHPVWNAVLGSALPLIMSAYLGIAESATSIAVAQARSRSTDAHVAPLVGRMLNRLTMARDTIDAMFASSGDLNFDATLDHSAVTLSRKTTATDAIIDSVKIALEICGGMGFSRNAGLERLYRDVHGALYHPLPSAKQEIFTGRQALDLDPLS